MNAIHGKGKSSGAGKRGPRSSKRGSAKLSDNWGQLVAKVREYGQELETQFSALGKRVQAARHALEMLGGHSANGRRKRRRRRTRRA